MNRDSQKHLYDVHSWAGFVVGIALLIVCLSGAAAVFSPEIDRMANPALQVSPGQPVRIDADRALTTLRAAAPLDAEPAVRLSLQLPHAGLPGLYGLMFKTDAGYTYAYLDAANGSLRPPRSNQVNDFLRHLHVRLLYDRLPVGIVGAFMLISIVTGLLIYKHILRDMFRMRWRRIGNVRVTFADFHKLVGFWALLFHIVIATTGTWLALEGYLKPVIAGVAGTKQPALYEGEKRALPADERSLQSIAPMIRKARASIADFEPTHATIDYGGKHPTVRIDGNVPGLVQENASYVRFDGRTGQIEKVYDVRQQSFWTQFRYALEAIHYGYYGGFWVKLLYLIVGLMPAALSITGALLWFERRKQAQRPARTKSTERRA
jgi:uncharacterized iron-regulated membrane protein